MEAIIVGEPFGAESDGEGMGEISGVVLTLAGRENLCFTFHHDSFLSDLPGRQSHHTLSAQFFSGSTTRQLFVSAQLASANDLCAGNSSALRTGSIGGGPPLCSEARRRSGGRGYVSGLAM